MDNLPFKNYEISFGLLLFRSSMIKARLNLKKKQNWREEKFRNILHL